MKQSFYLSLLCLLFFCVSYAGNTEKLNSDDSIVKSYQSRGGFEENIGQITGEDRTKVRFVFKSQEMSVFLMQNRIAYQINIPAFSKKSSLELKLGSVIKATKFNPPISGAYMETYRMDLILDGSNPNAVVSTENMNGDYQNFYTCNGETARSYGKVTYKDIYPYIDWVIYTSGSNIKYDFVVHPGGDPSNIRMRIAHAEKLDIDGEGNLILTNRLGYVKEKAPISYQETLIESNFKVNENIVTFDVSEYDPTKKLIIDPSIEWATYYGGGLYDQSYSVARDNLGFIYMCGSTQSSDNIAAGGYQSTALGDMDAFLVKFDSNGVRQWATYYGGTGQDGSYGCTVDLSGNVYLVGHTTSTSNITTATGHQSVYGGGDYDAFLVKFNPDGVRLWATYYGGNASDIGYSCVTAENGSVYMCGETNSSTNIALGGQQNIYGGNRDGFLVKFDSAGVRQWGSYYGGSGEEYCQNCSIDNQGNVYLAGSSQSASGISFAGHQNVFAGSSDAFLAKFNSSGTRQWATYYGGNFHDFGRSCVSDASGNVYLAGTTTSENNIYNNGYRNTLNGFSDAFLAKFSSAGVLQWGTYCGGEGIENGVSIASNQNGLITLCGNTYSNSDINFFGYQPTYGGNGDVFLTVFDSSGARRWGSYYGGPLDDEPFANIIDSSGGIYLCGRTRSTVNISFNGHQNIHNTSGGYDGFLVKLASCTEATITEQPLGGAICMGDNFYFNVGSSDGNHFQWQQNSGSGFIDLDDNATYSGTTNDTLLVTYAPQLINGYTFRCLVSKALGCPVTPSAPAELQVNPQLTPQLVITATPGVGVFNGEIISFDATPLQSGSNPILTWYKNDSPFSGVVGSSWIGVAGTDFQDNDQIKVRLETNAPCTSADSAWSNTLVVNIETVGVTGLASPSAVRISPNPATSEVSITGLDKSDLLIITNIFGQIKEQFEANGDILGVDISQYPEGIYFFNFIRPGQIKWCTKVVKY